MFWPFWSSTSPWSELQQMQREMNRLFGDFEPLASRRQGPPLNLWQGKDCAVLTAELPGVSPADIDVSVLDDQLTLRGKRETEAPGEEYTAVRRERGSGEFVRTLQLPFRVDSRKVEAETRNGVLCVKLPRAEEDKPKRITVKS